MIHVFLADGFEEIEAITVIDILKRAGIKVVIVGVGNEEVRGAHGISVRTDCNLDAILQDNITGVILPGGMPGTRNLLNNKLVCDIVKNSFTKGLLVGAICAAPMVLGKLGILDGKNACCYPGFEDELTGAVVESKDVVLDGNVVTSRGPGTAIQFALEIVGYLKGNDIMHKIREDLQCTI